MKKLILNHKSYLSYDEIINYKKELEKIKSKNLELVLMPNIAYLGLFKNSKITLGSQDFLSYNYGSYTGETSLELLKTIGVSYTLVGHPERIEFKLDTYEQIKDKLYKSINSSFKTILCIGHDAKIKTIKKELNYYLKEVDSTSIKNLIIAFEPSNKIEANEVDIKEIDEITTYIKNFINKYYNENIEVLYGGGITTENIKEVLEITDGVIIGKNGIDIEFVKKIIK